MEINSEKKGIKSIERERDVFRRLERHKKR